VITVAAPGAPPGDGSGVLARLVAPGRAAGVRQLTAPAADLLSTLRTAAGEVDADAAEAPARLSATSPAAAATPASDLTVLCAMVLCHSFVSGRPARDRAGAVWRRPSLVPATRSA
jgi:hypothetical protein